MTVFATRRVRVEDSSSDDEQGHSSSGAITATRLPEKQAVKEYGVQARAGGPVERVPRYRRRRLHLPISPCISLYLPVSPCISPYLPMSPHISSYRRRRRGEWRLEKVKPAVATVRVCYRDEMWWSRHGLLDAEPRSAAFVSCNTPP